MNILVTGAHVVLILAYTVLNIMRFNVSRFDGGDGDNAAKYRVETAWVLFGGFQDLFLTCMMFLMIDEEQRVNFLHDEKRNVNIAILDVINAEATHDSD